MADDEDIKQLLTGDIDLVNRDFRGANLAEFDLQGRDFSGAHLEGTNLRGANLTGSTLTKCHTIGMDIENAKFNSVSAESTVFHGVNFRKADLSDSKLARSHFTNANFSETNLIGTDLRNAVFNDGTTFEGAQTDETTLFDGASVFRPLSRQSAFRYYKVERGKLIRLPEPSENITELNNLPEEPGASDHFNIRNKIVQQVNHTITKLEELRPKTQHEISHGGIGHNQPPDEAPLNTSKFDHTIAELRAIREQALSEKPDRTALSKSSQVIREISGHISTWVARKLDLVAEEFAKQLGRTLADGKYLLAGWVYISGSLDQITALISTLF